MLRVVCDTNVLVSGLLFQGNEYQLLQAAALGRLELFSSEPILGELAGVLERKFNLTEEERADLLGSLRSFCRVVEPCRRVSLIVDDPDDDKIIECALEARADYIVSGDWHLLSAGGFEGIAVLRTSAMLQLL